MFHVGHLIIDCRKINSVVICLGQMLD